MTTLTANRETVDMFRSTRETLVEELERLAELTKDYPVVCVFAGHHYIFESEADIHSLIEEIRSAVELYDEQQFTP